MAEGARCEPSRDFLRHIANKVISENTAKIPIPIINDIRKALGRAEDKYKFSIFGGNPLRIRDYLKSQDFMDLVEQLSAHQLTWVLEKIIEALADEYSDTCPPVAEEAKRILEEIKKSPKERKDRDKMDQDIIYRTLKLHGYKVERDDSGSILIDEPGIRARIRVVNGVIEFQICRLGRASTLEALLARLEKIREL
ncbi:MAG: hypothetical protein LRS49_03440 [Desulfurococcales archaeon]|nr:hypothetical protein [Desulfurococcales archaeon]